MIRTERLALRPLADSDADADADADRPVELWKLPEVTRWLLRPARTLEELGLGGRLHLSAAGRRALESRPVSRRCAGSSGPAPRSP